MTGEVTVGGGRGVERFDAYMERCLYGPGGFYASTGSAGRSRGDFITSPEVGPLFGAVLARAIDGWWDELGRPEPFRVFDVGCGPGALLRAVSSAAPDRPWELIGVDRVDAAGAERHELPEDLSNSVVIANELLDNLPFRIVEQTRNGPAEVFIEHGDPGTEAREILMPLTAEPERPSSGWPDTDGWPVGTRAPVLEEAADWVANVIARRASVLCLFDYGLPTTEQLATRGGWLRTYRDHQRGADPLAHPGSCDITTDVAWDQLPTPDRLERQEEALRRWGLEELVEEGRQRWKEAAHAPDLTAIRMRSRISEAEALLDPDGLGGWLVAVWRASTTK